MTKLEIEAFLCIVKYGTISAAADKLYVTQPALSRRIAALEQELGYELMTRKKGIRSVTLTPEGAAFVAIAEKWNHIYREAQSLSRLHQKPILNLASIGSVSTYLLPPVLHQIIADGNPYDLCFHQYHSYESYGYVESGLVDLALISDDMYHRTVLTTPVFEEPFVLIGGPGWDCVDLIHPAALNPRSEIRLPWNPEFDAWHEKWFDVSICPKVQLDQMSLLEEFLTGEYFAIVPLHVAHRLKSAACHICRLKDGPAHEIIYALTNTNQTSKQELIRHFLGLLSEELKQCEGIRSYLLAPAPNRKPHSAHEPHSPAESVDILPHAFAPVPHPGRTRPS